MNNVFDNGRGLPSEIMIDIMSRLEASDVFDMRVVSKNWHGSIKNRKFNHGT